MRTDEKPPPPGFVLPSIVARALLATLFVAVAVASFMPTARLWGIHHLGYYSAALRWLVLALVALTFLPTVSRRIYTGLLKMSAPFASRTRTSLLLSIGGSVLAFAAFLYFRTATLLLGDGALQADIWRTMALRSEQTVAGFTRFVLSDFHQSIALGANIYNYVWGEWFLAMGSADALNGTFVFYALLGALVVLVMLLFMRRGNTPLAFRLIVVITVLLSGTMLLFFGYVETYQPMIVMTILFLVGSYYTITTGRRLLLPLMACVVAIFSCFQALLLAPSMMVLVVGPLLARKKPEGLRLLGIVVAVLTVAGTIVIRFLPKTSGFFLPLLSTERAYGVFSATHMLDVANEFLLTFPMVVPLVGIAVAMLVRTRKPPTSEPAPAPGKKRSQVRKKQFFKHQKKTDIALDWQWAFEIALFVPGVLFLVLFRPDLGMAHDWDLFVLPALCMVTPAFTPLRRWLSSGDADVMLPHLIVPAVALSAAIVVPWVGVNVNEVRSVERYKNIVASDKMSGAYGQEILAMHLRDRQQWAMSAETWGHAYSRSSNPRYLLASAADCFAVGDTVSARGLLKKCTEKHPTYELARRAYIDLLSRKSSVDELIKVAQKGVELYPRDPFYYFYLGAGLIYKGKLEDARVSLETCKSLDPPVSMRQAIDSMLERASNP
jgi:MFS family permease